MLGKPEDDKEKVFCEDVLRLFPDTIDCTVAASRCKLTGITCTNGVVTEMLVTHLNFFFRSICCLCFNSDWTGLGLGSIPSSLYSLKNLVTINVSHNNLDSFGGTWASNSVKNMFVNVKHSL